MKQLKKILLLLILILSFGISSFASTPEIYSGTGIVIEESTGKIVYNKNAFEIMYPASTTKILTAILTIENCNLTDTATASEYAINSIPSGYSTANIQIGETLTIKDLLYALMLKSANEAATILAEHVGGSEANFANMMNEKAKELGCKNTHFVNANGIHNENHISTAYDLALIAKYAMQNSTFKQIVSTTTYTLPATNKYELEDRTLTNTNALIINDENSQHNYYYPYATGIKTGFTSYAKNCLVSSSSKDGVNLICVILYADFTEDGISERYLDTTNLFNYIYDNYTFSEVLSKYSVVDTIHIGEKQEELNLLLENNIIAFMNPQDSELVENKQIMLTKDLSEPIHAGEIIGSVTYTIDGIDYTENIISDKDIRY